MASSLHPYISLFAIRLYDNGLGAGAPPYIFREAVIRGNIIRQIGYDPNTAATGVNDCEGAVVQNNIINLASFAPMAHTNCKSIRYFNNRNSAGTLIRGKNLTPIQVISDIDDAIDDIWVFKFLDME